MQILDYFLGKGKETIWLTTSRMEFDFDKGAGLENLSSILVDKLPENLPEPKEGLKYSVSYPIKDILPPDILAELKLIGFSQPIITVSKTEDGI